MKAIKRKNAYGMGGTFDQPGYEYDAVNDTFKDLETGKVFSKEYVAPTSGTDTVTPTVKLETNKEVSITANGEVEITPTSGKDAMEKVTANVAVPVPVLESNKATSIDVSQYTEPVVITPTEGKDGMEQTTVTLTNVPSPSGLYAWRYGGTTLMYLNIDVAPSAADVGDIKLLTGSMDAGTLSAVDLMHAGDTYTRVSDGKFTIAYSGGTDTYTRNTEATDVQL